MNNKTKLIVASSIGLSGFALGFLVGGSPRGVTQGQGERSARGQSGDQSDGQSLRWSDRVGAQGKTANPMSTQFAGISASSDKESKLFAALRDPDDLRRMHDLFETASSLTLEELPAL